MELSSLKNINEVKKEAKMPAEVTPSSLSIVPNQKTEKEETGVSNTVGLQEVAFEFQLKHVAPKRNVSELTLIALISEPTILILAGCLLIGNATIATMEVLLPLLLHNQMGLSPGIIGLVYGSGTFCYMVAAPIIPRFISPYLTGKRWGSAMLGLIFQAIPLPLIPLILRLEWIIPLWIIVNGGGMAGIDVSVNPQLADEVDRLFGKGVKGYARAYGIAESFLSVGFVIGPLISSAILQADGGADYIIPFLIFCCFNLAFVPALIYGHFLTTIE